MPHLMYQNGSLRVLNIYPGHPMNLNCPYRISKSEEAMIIDDFKKCLNHRRQLLGSNIVRRPRLGDRMISVLYYGESIFLNGESMPILFYDILPKRG